MDAPANRFALFVFCLSLTVFLTPTVSHAQADVPKEIASKVFLKVLKFDQTFQSADDPGVLVAHNSEDASKADFFVGQLQDAGYRSEAVAIGSIGDQINAFQALLIASPGTDSSVYEEQAESNNVLTISLDPSKVEDGSSSIGVKLVNDKPELLFHLKRLEEEGHNIPSKVLKLGTVYGK